MHLMVTLCLSLLLSPSQLFSSPCDEVDFSSLRRFRNSQTAKVLVLYRSVNVI